MNNRRSFSCLQPEDYAKHIERDRERFTRNILINPSMWKIARTLGLMHTDGYVTEGLRGTFDANEGQHGQIIWWPAGYASHHQGRLFLKQTGDDILEVEANVMENGTIILFWSSFGFDNSEKFLNHPTLQGNMDGALTVRGKIVQIREKKILLHDDMPDAVEKPDVNQYEGWSKIEELGNSWKRRRKSTMPDGSRTPNVGSQRAFRNYMHSVMTWRYHDPVPVVSVTGKGEIRFEWRKTGSVAEIIFRDEGLVMKMNDNGKILRAEIAKVRKGSDLPWQISTRLLSFKSANEKT